MGLYELNVINMGDFVLNSISENSATFAATTTGVPEPLSLVSWSSASPPSSCTNSGDANTPPVDCAQARIHDTPSWDWVLNGRVLNGRLSRERYGVTGNHRLRFCSSGLAVHPAAICSH
jgi:hypothetical protein